MSSESLECLDQQFEQLKKEQEEKIRAINEIIAENELRNKCLRDIILCYQYLQNLETLWHLAFKRYQLSKEIGAVLDVE